jgi:hypothetical protein
VKRRDFIRTSVGAGFIFSLPRGFIPFSQQQGPATLFDKIWDAHVIVHLGGDAYLLQVDRCIGGSPNGLIEMLEAGI